MVHSRSTLANTSGAMPSTHPFLELRDKLSVLKQAGEVNTTNVCYAAPTALIRELHLGERSPELPVQEATGW